MIFAVFFAVLFPLFQQSVVLFCFFFPFNLTNKFMNEMMYAKYRKYAYWILVFFCYSVERVCTEMSFSAWENVYCVDLLFDFQSIQEPREYKKSPQCLAEQTLTNSQSIFEIYLDHFFSRCLLKSFELFPTCHEKKKVSSSFSFVLQNKKFIMSWLKWLVRASTAEIPLFAKKSKPNWNLKLNTLTHLISFSFNYWF